MTDLYQYIEEWKEKSYYEDFRTLVDLTYELQSRYKSLNVKLNSSIEKTVRTFFRGLKFAIKDAEEMYCPPTTVQETKDSILNQLIIREKVLAYELNQR